MSTVMELPEGSFKVRMPSFECKVTENRHGEHRIDAFLKLRVETIPEELKIDELLDIVNVGSTIRFYTPQPEQVFEEMKFWGMIDKGVKLNADKDSEIILRIPLGEGVATANANDILLFLGREFWFDVKTMYEQTDMLKDAVEVN